MPELARRPQPALVLGRTERSLAYAVGRRFARDPDAADDIAQEALLLAHRHREAFRGDSHPHTWLYRIASTTALEALRRRRRQVARETALAALTPAATNEIAPDAALATQERIAAVLRGLADLDEKYAAVLRLRIADLGDREIAEQLGISVGAVKVRAHRARTLLRAALADAA